MMGGGESGCALDCHGGAPHRPCATLQSAVVSERPRCRGPGFEREGHESPGVGVRQGTHTQAAESRRVADYKPGSITGRGAGALEADPGLPERGPLSPQASTRSGSSTWEEPSAAAEVRAPSPSEPIWDHPRRPALPGPPRQPPSVAASPHPVSGPASPPARPRPRSPQGRPRAGVHPFPAAARAPHQPPRRRWRRAIPAAILAAYLLHAAARPSCRAPPPGPQAPRSGPQSTPGRFWRRITPLFSSVHVPQDDVKSDALE